MRKPALAIIGVTLVSTLGGRKSSAEGAEGVGCGEGCPLPTENFYNLCMKITHFGGISGAKFSYCVGIYYLKFLRLGAKVNTKI